MDWSGADDRLLVSVASGGGPDHAGAFDAIYYRHRDFVHRVARKHGADEHAAWDTVQEVFVFLAGRLGEGRVRVEGRLTTYLYPIARSVAISHLRKQQARRRAETASAAAQEAQASHAPPGGAAGTMREQLLGLLDSLPDAQREVLWLRAIEQMTIEEIATALDVPAGTVKSRLHHAIQAIQRRPAAREDKGG
jgi:RNA polymerase sigma-70 factor (ECF subfamily)